MVEKNEGPKKEALGQDKPEVSKGGVKDKPPTDQNNPQPAEENGSTIAADDTGTPKSGKRGGSKATIKSNAKKKKRSRKVPDNTECQNCGAVLQGDFCHQCGQAAREPRRLVIGLVQDVFVETLAIDGKLARSIGLLLWRPGVLARRFLDGKRVRYSPPFRLYLFASVFFFLTAFWMIDLPNSFSFDNAVNADPAEIAEAQAAIEEAQREVATALGEAAPDEIRETAEEPAETLNDDADADSGATDAEELSGERDAAEVKRSFVESEWGDGTYNYSGPASLEPHVRRFYEASQRVVSDPRLFVSELRANVPRFLLLAPLIYGLILTLLYFYRRKFFIYDHFIVSLYMHAALYAYLMAALLLSRVPVMGGLLAAVPIVWGGFQPLIVFRQAYGSNWFSVWAKWFVSTSIYVIALMLIIILGLSYSLYQS